MKGSSKLRSLCGGDKSFEKALIRMEKNVFKKGNKRYRVSVA
jgi:hypothetical protein